MTTLQNFTGLYRTVFFCFSLAWYFGGKVFAQTPVEYYYGPFKDKDIIEAKFQTWKPEAPRGVIVMLACFDDKMYPPNQDEMEDIELWKQYALSHNLALSLVDIVADGAKVQQGGGYKKATLGGSKVFRTGIADTFFTYLPVYVYGRNRNGNLLLLSMVRSTPDLINGWCCFCHGTQEWDIPNVSPKSPPGIVAVTSDSIYLKDIQQFYQTCRSRGVAWTFLTFPPAYLSDFRQFVREYFNRLLEEQDPCWRDIEQQKNNNMFVDVIEDNINPNKNWFPHEILAAQAKKLVQLPVNRPTVIEKEVDLRSRGLDNLKFYLRIPAGKTDLSKVDGVLAYCTWATSRDALLQQLTFDTNQPTERQTWMAIQMLRFASQHNLAVLTWSTPGKWDTSRNADELSASERQKLDRDFSVYATAWDKAVSEFCRDYQLPEKDYLLYGMSRGAQWAHRLLLRNPKRFLAVNIHVNSTYDIPNDVGKNCLWLITTGKNDYGYVGGGAQWFYHEALKLNYPILIKVAEGLGHETRKDVEELRDVFFEYALSIKKQREINPHDFINLSELFSSAKSKFIGDFDSQRMIFTEKQEEIPQENRVYFPTEKIAEAWNKIYISDEN
ncbi:MAG: hypothetical protein LBK76_01560 [Verrucomicrobiales bacterium]|jgi:predicted esterase|nr:hypothetical protein [Verrucomicrobiales bacterium]